MHISKKLFKKKEKRCLESEGKIAQNLILRSRIWFQSAQDSLGVCLILISLFSRCKMYFYLEDDSIQVIEPKVENSGIPQGNNHIFQNIIILIDWRCKLTSKYQQGRI